MTDIQRQLAALRVYAMEYMRTGFQGGLNYYRVGTEPLFENELQSFSARTIDVPSCFIGGDREWAVYQSPGAVESMRTVCTRLLGVHLVRGAGHSVAEEQPEAVNRLLLGCLQQAVSSDR